MAENNLIKPCWKLNNHHIIPISTGGEDIRANIVQILDRDHKQIHDTLDIPVRFYSSKVRNIKEKTNHHLISKPETVELWWDLQKEYFSRIHQLPHHIQKAHLDSMMVNLKYRDDQCKRITKDSSLNDWQPQGKTISDKFHYTHDEYLDVKKQICKEIAKILYLNNT